MRSVPVALLIPVHLYELHIELTFALGKGSRYETTLIQNDGSTIVSLYKAFVYDVHIKSLSCSHPSLIQTLFGVTIVNAQLEVGIKQSSRFPLHNLGSLVASSEWGNTSIM